MKEDGRTRPLKVVCQKGERKAIEGMVDLGFKGAMHEPGFRLEFVEVGPWGTLKLNELELGFAPTRHAVQNLAVRVSDGRNVVCYSGDGSLSKDDDKLYWNADLVIHECFTLDRDVPEKSNLRELIGVARRRGVTCLALTHISRAARKEAIRTSGEAAAGAGVRIIVPEPLEEYSF
jgi:ribonuclease BN (tRNA processing enzyme)